MAQGVTTSSLSLSFDYEAHALPGLGTYYTLVGESDVQVSGGRPSLPRTSTGVHITGTLAHGALMVGGTFTDVNGYDPVIARVVTDVLSTSESLYPTSAWYPVIPGTLNRFLSIEGISYERLVVVPAQFQATGVTTPTTGTLRLYSALQFDIYHAPFTATDFIAPSIWQVEAISTSVYLRFRVQVEDDSGEIGRVIALYRRLTGNTWNKVELVYNPLTGWAEGDAAVVEEPIEYLVQAVDPTGNVAVALDRGRPFRNVKDVYLPPIFEVVKTASDLSPSEGDVITYTVTVRNTWGKATGGLISDTLPAGLELVGPVTLQTSGPGSAGTLPTLAYDLVIKYGQAVTATFPVRVLEGPATLVNTAAVTSEQVITPTQGAVSIHVANVAPSVNVGPDRAVYAGVVVTFTGAFTDPGVLDTHTITWDLGDGSLVAGALTVTHSYPISGIYTVTLTVSDDDGGVGQDMLQVTVTHPTAVGLVSFLAVPDPDGIMLRWETASELDRLGFNLYRATSPEGPYRSLNTAMILALRPGSPLGATYTWMDQEVSPGLIYYYKLEAMDTHGQATVYGPVQVSAATVPPFRLYLPLVMANRP